MDVRFPIGKLEVPEHVTLSDVQEWLDNIREYTYQLRTVVDGLDDEALAKTYREGSWNVRQLVHHIADSQLNMYQRLKLALTDDNPQVPPFIQDKWAVQPDTNLPIEPSIRMLEGINERIAVLGQTLTEAQLTRVFTLQGSGEIDVATKVAKLAWHEVHHLEHIKIALSQ
ncbi:putative metal-dependent hydrolase [Staphylococcus arlettae]|uniref:Metal-dependent hydrolase n=1 Tax=Staphylococcus arlettae TaxID=29378 RepID=A0A380BVI5_9STAP|nr:MULTISPECIES: putative metal-dependent hydrolase [Staphylococcus]HAP2020378.1 putative metal-dependent hydrolase [Escherichia coli]MEB5898885.1 putative metal-dependent hydrolase [Staphylococcus arlettae]NKE83596.1 putative metal-dependent hydrolase [Staphylococcus arlettae]PNZ54515.1 metal-dependent hydrolase [Staphylococcus arlettae]URN39383.1 putative metal-dependent hydrolase [Staphylococcus arlettae]